ncbi:leucine-rich repeat flightless-interacting protein 1 isoform X2 [Phacochoerus africanus]|uniref:leucine-rich repeat flightless-interacting protein 1 isoform X2 n=1 Tax=Phacochoerus africanus TaxID=41426 RepID=UPI001FD9803F|nr:leucine-rich repeat flightless-interacting protein 1 isoform X2 [Phacochoerus africanus]
MDMGTQGSGRKRLPNRERLTAEDDALNQIAREAEARLAAKRAARAEAREIRMKELERQQKEIYQVQKKYYGLDSKWGDIEQWMEDSERYSRRSRRNTSASDEDERMSVGSRGSLRPDVEFGGPYAWTNGYDGELYGPQSLSRRSGRNSSYGGDGRFSTLSSAARDETLPFYLCSAAGPAGSYRASVLGESSLAGARRGSACGSYAPSEHSGQLKSSSRASSRASSARASPVVEERSEKDFEKGSRSLPSLSAATLASLGGTSSRRGSGDTSISLDTEASIREIKELNELKDQIQDVEGRYMQGLKEMKDSLAEAEEKYKKAMVSNAQLDNEKTNFMYQVDTLKDVLLELEEQLAESRRQLEEKSKEFEREKHAHSILQFQFAEVKEALKQREELLEEIRQLQQKQESYIREISDLQETIEWKDKKIGALERQKEFFDSVRSERDDLREEVVVLKEELKKHGVILNSETAANGETSEPLNRVAHPGSTKMTKEELSALQAPGDGTLGRASEVEVANEMVERVGKSEILPDSEQERHREEPGKDCADPEVLPPGETAEDPTTSEDSGPSSGTFVNPTNEEQVQSPILEHPPFLENTQQVQSREALHLAGHGPEASPGQSECFRQPDGEIPGPALEQDGGNAVESEPQRKESAEKQEGLQTNVEERSPEPPQEPAPVQISDVEVERQSSADTGVQSQRPAEAVPEAELPGVGEQVGSGASSPPRCSDDPVSHQETGVAGAPGGSDPGTGCDLEKEPAPYEVAEPAEGPVQSPEAGGENSEEEGGGREFRGENLAETEAPTVPCSPAAKHSPQEAVGLSTPDSESEPLDVKEPDEEKGACQGERPDASQKKTKNKKKKNKKKKSPAPVEAKDVQEELTLQSPDLSDGREDEQVKCADEKPGAEAQNGVPENPQQNEVAGSRADGRAPEDPRAELERTPSCADADADTEAEKPGAAGDPGNREAGAVPSSGTSARRKGSDQGVPEEAAAEQQDAAAPGRLPDPEKDDLPGRAPLQDQSPSGDGKDASQTEDAEDSSPLVRRVSESLSLEGKGPAPAGELEGLDAESKDERRGGNGKGRSKDECALS